MGGKDDLGPLIDRVLNGRKRTLDTGVVLNLSAVYRNIKINADKNGLAGDIHIFDRLLLHHLPTGSARSKHRSWCTKKLGSTAELMRTSSSTISTDPRLLVILKGIGGPEVGRKSPNESPPVGPSNPASILVSELK